MSDTSSLLSWMRRRVPDAPPSPGAAVAVDVTDVIDDVLPVMMRTPGRPALEAIAAAMSRRGRHIDTDRIATLVCGRPVTPPPLERLFDDPIGRVVFAE